jgi:light-regulated signal transduction histidine kinase (bacteriophytochrome)
VPEYIQKYFQGCSQICYQIFCENRIGIVLSKHIIEAHGGRIWAENNNVDGKLEKGATFYFSWPVIKNQGLNMKSTTNNAKQHS